LFKEKINFKLPGGAGFKAHQVGFVFFSFALFVQGFGSEFDVLFAARS
jgi:hypothetical protein